MLRPSSLGLVCLLLTGCVVTLEDPRQTGSSSQHVSISLINPNGTETTESPPPVVVHHTEPAEPPKPTTPQSSCPIFQLPPTRTIPKMMDLSDPNISTREDIEIALATYINDLKGYISDERERLVRRHETYLDACG